MKDVRKEEDLMNGADFVNEMDVIVRCVKEKRKCERCRKNDREERTAWSRPTKP